jgi:hypothetical protein
MGPMPASCWRRAVGLLRTRAAAAVAKVTAVARVVVVAVAAEAEAGAVQPSRAVVAALRSSLAVEVVAVLSFNAGAVELRLFVVDLNSAAARTCACVPALTSGSGGATDRAIATVIADRAWAFTSQEAGAGVTGTIGAGACSATVTHTPIGGIAMGVGVNNFR